MTIFMPEGILIFMSGIKVKKMASTIFNVRISLKLNIYSDETFNNAVIYQMKVNHMPHAKYQ